ncbi:MAG TPA: cytochrome c [Thermohalobaculum sp.]|nr:cytochrome c [Thermohalobaculum sp.]
MTRTTTTKISLAALAAAVLAAPVTAPAQEAEPDNAIKFRQSVMKGIGGPTGAVGGIVKGEVAHQELMAHFLDQLATAAEPQATTAAFRQNTADQGMAKTTALPDIWENWDDFEERLQKLGEVTTAAAEAGADVTQDQLKAIFDTCKGCHDEYRED